MRKRLFGLACLVSLVGTNAAAQEALPEGHPPIGAGDMPMADPHAPAEGDVARPLPEGHPPIDEGGDGAAAGDPHGGMGGGDPHGGAMGGGGDPHGGAMGGGEIRLPAEDSKDAVEEDASLPAGTIVVRVVEPSGNPVPNQPVEVVILKSDQTRERKNCRTGADGKCRVADLPRGSGQAYRAYAPHRGAKYGSEPFQLVEASGTLVTLTRWPVTSAAERLLLFFGNLFVEFGEEGMRCTQHMRLMNFGAETIVPNGGALRIPLPEGARAFQAQPVMTDQRLSTDEHAVLVTGSFPPGETTLIYGYQVPIEGTTANIAMRVPFRTIIYQVMVERAPGMSLDIRGMPDAEEQELEDGRTFLASRIERRPGSAPFDRLDVRIGDLPGKGVGRWLALAATIALVGAGIFAYTRPGSVDAVHAAGLRAERERLLAAAVTLEREHAAAPGAMDDEAYRLRRDRIVTRLAEVLRADEAG